jgi:hypothetical protein
MREFQYISEKILDAEFREAPFKHLLIEDFLTTEHLNIILKEPQIHFEETENIEDLMKKLHEKGWEIINFPGCVEHPSMVEKYIQNLKEDSFPYHRKGNPVESYGLTYRLKGTNNEFINKLVRYMKGSEFKSALQTKFEITKPTKIVTAIQKNLSHYEISPHPDIREKALTYLLNINKDSSVDDKPVHTHLLRFKDEWNFIKKYWERGSALTKNRCWVPWDWCETAVTTNKNNSFVLFSPSNDTLHAAKMKYDHNKFQRTQLYGNLMYSTGGVAKSMNYKHLEKMREKETK